MIVYLICYAASWIFARFGLYYLSGAALFLAAGYLYAYDYRRSGNLIHLRGLFFLLLGWRSGGCLSEAFKASDRPGRFRPGSVFSLPCGLLDHIRGLRPVDGRK